MVKGWVMNFPPQLQIRVLLLAASARMPTFFFFFCKVDSTFRSNCF